MTCTILTAGPFGHTGIIITQEAIDRFVQKYANEKIPLRNGDSLQEVYGAVHKFEAKPGRLEAECLFLRPEIGTLLEFPDKFSVACTLTVDRRTGEPDEILSADIVCTERLCRGAS